MSLLHQKQATAQRQGSRLNAAARYEALGLCAAFFLLVLYLAIQRERNIYIPSFPMFFMGTTKTRVEKISFLQSVFLEAKAKNMRIDVEKLCADFCLRFFCKKSTFSEILSLFSSSGRISVKDNEIEVLEEILKNGA